MVYSDDSTRNRLHYTDADYDLDLTEVSGMKSSGLSRDQYDTNMRSRQNQLAQRHVNQLEEAADAERSDENWLADKKRVAQLNQEIRTREKNYDTYSNSIEVEKTLYNRERHRTFLLATANVFAVAGCIYMWSSSMTSP
tara:strand:+ start:931 stop:1347 length:417 start_codon:yes stop_codon:yes gene_type:complete